MLPVLSPRPGEDVLLFSETSCLRTAAFYAHPAAPRDVLGSTQVLPHTLGGRVGTLLRQQDVRRSASSLGCLFPKPALGLGCCKQFAKTVLA